MLGPVVVTPDEFEGALLETVVRVGDTRYSGKTLAGFAWQDALALAAAGTMLRPGDVIAGGAPALVPVPPGDVDIEIAVDGVGALELSVG